MGTKDINQQMKRALLLGRILGSAAYAMDTSHRRIVRRNLRFAFPDWTGEQIRQTTRHVFHHLGVTLVEVCQLAAASRDDLTARVKVVGPERWQQALDDAGIVATEQDVDLIFVEGVLPAA